MACVEMEAAFDELEPELRGQAAGQLRGQGPTWEFVRRQGVIADELIAVAAGLRDARLDQGVVIVIGSSSHAAHRMVGFGRCQPGPPFTGSPRDRALGSRRGKPRPGSGTRRMRTVTSRSVRNFSNIIPSDPRYHLLATEALSSGLLVG
jgi:hypothetical protein